MEIHEPTCPRCGPGFIQIIDFTEPAQSEMRIERDAEGPYLRVVPAEVLYVCHGCDRTYGHPVPAGWLPPKGWLPAYAE